ncbi:MAG TPA: glycosyltransferase, partial [bacterium]|nr:glycosyltransferase [bacterium]
MRIALFGPTHPIRGGIAHYTTLLARALRTRHEVDFFSIGYQYPDFLYPGGEQYARSVEPDDILEPNEPIFHSLQPWTWDRLVSRVVRGNYDLFIPTWWTIFFAASAAHLNFHIRRRGGPPVVWLCHNVKMHESRPASTALTRFALRGAAGYVVHSQEDYANLQKLLPGAR